MGRQGGVIRTPVKELACKVILIFSKGMACSCLRRDLVLKGVLTRSWVTATAFPGCRKKESGGKEMRMWLLTGSELELWLGV
ncbi:hypothetical protein AVEN_272179-1 [Araneus ventricosus]|uniref:Uncharacterized protein n=1 Tax=Araneus ventricosus TaxID=182803 RepID=A0A4Y2HVA5_ARAVE|nr:hypothetical protein AVEN_272179-1 [Araneus ventricosus]